MDITQEIKQQIEGNAIILYMKGSPDMPQCGFSAKSVQVLQACGEKFAFVDVLSNPEVRANLHKYANWPTFPQLYINGELIGGCDIITELYSTGELQQKITSAVNS